MQARDDLVSQAAMKDQEKQELSDALSKAQLEIEKATKMTDDMKAQRGSKLLKGNQNSQGCLGLPLIPENSVGKFLGLYISFITI